MIIDGKAIADQIQEEIKQGIANLKGPRKPCLGVVLVGEHPPSQIYVARKTQACECIGIHSIKRQFSMHTPEHEILAEIERLNQDPLVDGILVQLPLPEHVNPYKVIQSIDPEKDVDGFHPLNVGKMLIGETDGFFPCTPLGIKTMLERTNIELTGKHALVIGRSNIVGKPMAAMLMQSTPSGNATVTIANKHTANLKEICLQADILIVAIGKPQFITVDMVKEGAVVIDVGINKIPNPQNPNGYLIVGDVDFANVKDKCSFISPVPKGVGPMTIAMLLSNTWLSFRKRLAKQLLKI
jgi:methylenetetrahydrofolate dehydrogenase (NADP+) / methenyltetrahydrofolate cyclohydrolase